MTAPAQVRKQAEESERALKELEQQGKTQPPAGDGAAAPQNPTSPEAAGETGGITEQLAKLQADYHALNARHASLQGKYGAEVQQRRELDETVKALQKQVADLAAATPKQPEVPAYMRRLSKEERENYDESALAVQGKVAEGVTEDKIAQLRREIDTRFAQLTQEQDRLNAMTRESEGAKRVSAFLQEVEKLCPGAIDIDSHSERNGWKEFLDTYDAASGVAYRQLAVAAMNAGDVRRVAAIIEEFKTQAGLKVPGADVASQARPAKVRASAPPQPGKKRMIPASEFEAFCKDKALGRLKCSPEEAKQLEAEYDAAMRENRFTQG